MTDRSWIWCLWANQHGTCGQNVFAANEFLSAVWLRNLRNLFQNGSKKATTVSNKSIAQYFTQCELATMQFTEGNKVFREVHEVDSIAET